MNGYYHPLVAGFKETLKVGHRERSSFTQTDRSTVLNVPWVVIRVASYAEWYVSARERNGRPLTQTTLAYAKQPGINFYEISVD